MKNSIVLSTILMMAFPAMALASFDINLRYGSKGEAVVELQEFLTDEGLYSGPITGNFYSLTKRAVQKFQTREGVNPAAGFFGPVSRARANEILNLAASDEQAAIETKTSIPVPSGTIPAVPATPATPTPGSGVPAVPAQPATPAIPASGTTTPPTPPVVPPPAPAPTQIVVDDFDSYAPGTIVGQGGWKSYSNGQNFVVQGATAHQGAQSLYIGIGAGADSVATKAGNLLKDGMQAFYVRTENRALWSAIGDGNAQIRVSRGSWASGAPGLAFAAMSFKADGNVAYYDKGVDRYENFATYNDNSWTLLEVEWRSSDASARYRINQGAWTDWHPFTNGAGFAGFDHVGFDFVGGGTGGVYFDTLQ